MTTKPKKSADFTTEVTIPMTVSKAPLFLRREIGKCTDPETGEIFWMCISLTDGSYLLDMPDGSACVLKAEDLLKTAIAAWRGRK